jgi:hypothetical protein
MAAVRNLASRAFITAMRTYGIPDEGAPGQQEPAAAPARR